MRVSGNLHYSTVVENGFARRESREAVSKNPYGYMRSTEPAAASRDAGPAIQSFE